MGDIKKEKKKYRGPLHPWQKERIEEEKTQLKEYGFKNKKEIWKISSLLIKFKNQAKKLTAAHTEQTEKEKEQLLNRVQALGLLEGTPTLDGILGLTIDDLMGRRLQTVVLRKGLAKSIKQARQFITHGHITIADKKITKPNCLVLKDEEARISFPSSSPLSREDHPERLVGKAVDKEKKIKRVRRKRGRGNDKTR